MTEPNAYKPAAGKADDITDSEVEDQSQGHLSTGPEELDTATGFDLGGRFKRHRRTVDYVGRLFCGRYEIKSLIGSGGMGSVYRAHFPALGKDVAVKILHTSAAEDDAAFKRFEREAKATSKLSHPNLAPVSDFGVDEDGAPYFVMEYVEGESLATLIDKNADQKVALEPMRVIDLFLQVAEAIGYAHSKGVVHRDLKPSNIIVARADNGGDLVKVVDFGIAKVLSEQSDSPQSLTQTGEILGSPLYMSPEQCTGTTLDNRSDLYSIGCVMYEALSGRPPLAGDNTVQTILKHVNEMPSPLAQVVPGLNLPAGLEAVVLRCMQKGPAERYQSAADLAADLRLVKAGKPIAAHQVVGGRLPSGLLVDQEASRAFKRKTNIILAAFTAAAVVSGVYLASYMQHKKDAALLEQQVRQAMQPAEKEYATGNLDDWNTAIESEPNEPHNYFGRGRLYEQSDERVNAIEDFTKTIELDPEYWEAYEHRAGVYALISQYDKAMADAEYLVKKQPELSGAYSSRAFVELAREQNRAAVADLEKAINIDEGLSKKFQDDPNYTPFARDKFVDEKRNDIAFAQYLEAGALRDMGQLERALKVITRAIERSDYDNQAIMYGQRATIYGLMQQFEKAGLDALNATNRGNARGVEWFVLAYTYVGAGNMAQADAAMEKALALETFPARGYRLKGEILRVAGKNDQALAAYNKSTSLEPYAPAYRSRAVVYIVMGKYHNAEADLIKADKINPDNPLTLSYLARAQDQNGKADLADTTIKRAFESFESSDIDPMLYVNRGAISLRRNKIAEALEDANRAIAADANLREAYELRRNIAAKTQDVYRLRDDEYKVSKLLPRIEF